MSEEKTLLELLQRGQISPSTQRLVDQHLRLEMLKRIQECLSAPGLTAENRRSLEEQVRQVIFDMGVAQREGEMREQAERDAWSESERRRINRELDEKAREQGYKDWADLNEHR